MTRPRASRATLGRFVSVDAAEWGDVAEQLLGSIAEKI